MWCQVVQTKQILPCSTLCEYCNWQDVHGILGIKMLTLLSIPVSSTLQMNNVLFI